MKTCICVQIKNENLYLLEFVEYYYKLGFSKMYIYDNNDYEIPNLIIQKYIDNGFAEIINIRNIKQNQQHSYQDCYDRYKNEYDWFLFCDCDEYLILQQHNNINDYLSDNKFNEYQCIFINWRIMNDGYKNLCYYENKSLLERFDYFNEDDGVNKHTKSILRGSLKNINWINSGTHSPIKQNIKVCDCEGNNIEEINNILYGPNYNLAYFKHFIVKTPVEYILSKVKRGCPDLSEEENNNRHTKDFYFAFSKWTKEKEEIFNNYGK